MICCLYCANTGSTEGRKSLVVQTRIGESQAWPLKAPGRCGTGYPRHQRSGHYRRQHPAARSKAFPQGCTSAKASTPVNLISVTRDDMLLLNL